MRCYIGGAWSTARGIVTRVPVSSASSGIGSQVCAHHVFQGFQGLGREAPSEDGIRFMSNLLTASYLIGRSYSKSKKLLPLPDTSTLFSRLPVCANVSDNAWAFFVAARPTGQNTRQRVLAVAFSALVGIGSRGGWDTRRTAEPADLAGC